ncbi:MAG: type VI secretion system baseplate subunit TssE [Gammaproteobacteria bacterium]|nr:type VI secretion system baseplate subunit TssE [Gammaproteobacteria bacterium]
MARIEKHQELLPSILDRLTDNTIYSHDPSLTSSFQRIKELRQSVRRDLENLFNTRFRITELPQNLEQLDNSLVNYGLPDLATINLLDSTSRSRFCRFLEATIRKFEPRFKNVEVSHVGNVDENDRTMRFRIEAVLYAEPLPETIIFNSVLEPVTRTVKIEDIQ